MGSQTGPGRGRRPTGGQSFDDILASMGIDGTVRPQTRTTTRPPVHEATAEITLDEAFHGTTRLVDVDGKRLEVTIPKGADTGTRIRLTGKGPAGGDIVIVVRQEPDPVFTRRGPNLERDLPITLGEALLGSEVPVRSPKGRVLLTIPAGTQPGRTFRLRGRGMPRFKGEGFGDLLVRLKVVLPTELSDDARAAAEAFIELADQPDPRTTRPDMQLDRFTQKAQEAVLAAQEAAGRLNSPVLDAEHLLSALVEPDDGIPAETLRRLGVDLAAFRGDVAAASGAPSPHRGRVADP